MLSLKTPALTNYYISTKKQHLGVSGLKCVRTTLLHRVQSMTSCLISPSNNLHSHFSAYAASNWTENNF